MTAFGTVYLVGAGPGDPGLITVAGLDVLRRADVVACDRLVGRDLLCEVRAEAEMIHVGKAPGRHTKTQEEICSLIVDRARAGKLVVRLKGGDPFVFGRGFEELCACREAGVPCVVIPGVTSAIAAPAAVGIPVTDRRHVRAFAVVSGHAPKDGDPTPINDTALAAMDTVVVLMGRENLADVTLRLIRGGRSPETPVVCIERATTVAQRACRGTLGTIVGVVQRAGLTNPMVAVVGEVAGFATVEQGATEARPLAGRRVLVTRPRTRRDALREGLRAAGAVAISCPLIRFVPPDDHGPLDCTIRGLSVYQWVVFTSREGVRAFWARLCALGGDARWLSPCKVAAVGPATAGALRHRGVVPDLVPARHTADSLANELASRTSKRGRVLLPRSDIAPRALPDRLCALGFSVESVVAYRTLPIDPGSAVRDCLAAGVDAVTFCSPSAVRAFSAGRLEAGSAVVACIGPPTAEAARTAGLTPTVVAEEHTAAGLVAALHAYFRGHRGSQHQPVPVLSW